MEEVPCTTIEDALAHLKRDPAHAVRLRVDNLTIEVRAIPEDASPRTAAEVFARIGPWAGETAEELERLLAEGRNALASRQVASW